MIFLYVIYDGDVCGRYNYIQPCFTIILFIINTIINIIIIIIIIITIINIIIIIIIIITIINIIIL